MVHRSNLPTEMLPKNLDTNIQKTEKFQNSNDFPEIGKYSNIRIAISTVTPFRNALDPWVLCLVNYMHLNYFSDSYYLSNLCRLQTVIWGSEFKKGFWLKTISVRSRSHWWKLVLIQVNDILDMFLVFILTRFSQIFWLLRESK